MSMSRRYFRDQSMKTLTAKPPSFTHVVFRLLLFPIGMSLLLMSGAGCGAPDSPTTGVTRYDGVELTVSVPEDSPLLGAIDLRLTEWQVRTGSKAQLIHSGVADIQIDEGNTPAAQELVAITPEALQSSTLSYSDFSPRYQRIFDVQGDDTVRIPLSTDGVFVWYRRDLFENDEIASEYETKTGKKLEPPITWKDYRAIAEFFHGHDAVKFGCSEAMDESEDAVRNFFVHAAAYGKGKSWSSFAIDTESGTPLLTAEPFRLALVDWISLRKFSPAGMDGSAISDSEARRIFRVGDAALLLSRIPPTVDPQSKESYPTSKSTGVVSLPGSETVVNPKTQSSETEEAINSCVHLGTTGWYVSYGKPNPSAAATDLLLFLSHAEETEFLVQAARHGVPPARNELLDQPERFVGYRLSPDTTRRWFSLLRNSFATENWIADLRTANASELYRSLAKHLSAALREEVSAEAALKQANEEWKEIIGRDRDGFLKEYRQSLGLPALIP